MRRAALLILAIPAVLSAQSSVIVPAAPANLEELLRESKIAEVKAAAQTLLDRDRGDAAGSYWMGRAFMQEGNSSAAVDWIEKAVKRDERNAVYHSWLGNALGQEAQKASKFRQPFLARRVKSAFERAVELDPKLLDARFGLLDFYSVAPGIMGGSMDKAREQAAEIARLNPMRGHLAAGRLALRAKDDSTAFREYAAAITASPDSTAGYYALGNIYRARAKWADALDVYGRLIARHPEELPAHAWYGIAAANGGIELERGERELKYFLANAPKETTPLSIANVHFRLGTIYEKRARPDQARAAYQEALRVYPEHQNAKKALNALKSSSP